jgi:hypothetical protein
MSCVEIGRYLAADPAVNIEGGSYEWGYGHELYAKGKPPPDPYSIARMVRTDITRAAAAVRQEAGEEAEAQREEHLLLLEGLFALAQEQAAKTGDPKLITAALKALDGIAKVRGLNAPVRAAVTVESTVSDDELLALISTGGAAMGRSFQPPARLDG